MKKILGWLLPIFLLFTGTACEKEKTAVTVATPGYHCRFSAEYNGLTVAGTADVLGKDALTVQVTEPATVAGICLEYKNQKATLKLKEKTYSSTQNSELSGLAGGIAFVLAELEEGQKLPLKSGLFVQEGTVQNTTYSLTFNENGFVKELNLPTKGVHVLFLDWKYEN